MKSSARGRTMAHMNKMLAASAAAVGCTRASDVQTVTITPLPTAPASAADTATAAPLPPVASATFTATSEPPPNPPPNPSGYMVVDMLPAPAHCLGVANASKATAKVHPLAGGGVVLELVVELPTGAAFAGTKFSGSYSAWSGQIVSGAFSHQSKVATVRVQPTSGTLGVSLGVACGARGPGTLSVTATFPSTPAVGSTPSIAMQDY